MNKLSAACYALSQETLKMVYYAYFHSIVNYGLIFWGNSSHGVEIFKIQKKVIRIITGCRTREIHEEIYLRI
jgi:hypothetical protein